MNSLFTLRTTLILFLIISCEFSLKAQSNTVVVPVDNDTTRIILVVTPRKTPPAKPEVKKRVYTAPYTAERPGTAAYMNPTPAKPIRTTTTGYAAPTTAERAGAVNYDNLPAKKPVYRSRAYYNAQTKRAANTTGTQGTSSNRVNGSNAAGTPIVTTQVAVVPSPVILPVKHDTVFVKKTDTVTVKKTDTVFIKQIAERKTRTNKILFGELGGPGLAISLNYDARFTSERNGWGFRIGAGYYGNGGNTVFTVPFQVNYLVGSGNNFLELGAGTTFLNSTGDNTGKTFIFDRDTGLIGTATIGYRYQSDTNKLNFRLGFVPILYDEGIIWAGGVSIGYTF